jgi:pimeloyl-ACP methyl ester carboxylesterase
VASSAAPALAVFLPGIFMPATVRYAALTSLLPTGVRAVAQELAVYAEDAPPADYSVQTELDALSVLLDRHGASRAHLYGHSAGASIALAFTAAHPDRVQSLALDEPASDFSAADRATLAQQFPTRLADLPVPERMRTFAASLVRPGVEPPTPPTPPPGPESAKRPAGLSAWETAMHEHELDTGALRRFAGPVYFSYGSLSSRRWEDMAARVSSWFPRCRVERYEGLHHLNTSHQAQPERVAAALGQLWEAAGRTA